MSNNNSRRSAGTKHQGVDEEIVYTITTTQIGSDPTSPSVAVYDATDDHEDVTATVMPTGSPSVAGDVITLPTLKDLTIDHEYRVEVQFTLDGNLIEVYFLVVAER